MSEPRTQIIIDTPGPTITIVAGGDLDTVAAKALELFAAVAAIPLHATGKPGHIAGFGAHIEQPAGVVYASAHEVDMRGGT